MKTILLVEDDQTLAEMYRISLVQEGFDVIMVNDGEKGLSVALERRPDLLLLDIGMPKMDGVTVMRRIRETAWGKKVPIIILTNYEPNDTILQGIVEGQPSYYLLKTESTPSGVITKIKEALHIS